MPSRPSERPHIENAEPRVLRMRRWWRQVSQRPAGGGIGRIIAPNSPAEVNTSLRIVRVDVFAPPPFRIPEALQALGCWGSLVFAWLAMGVTVLIPLLIGDAVNAFNGDDPDKAALLPLALAILGAGVLRLGLTVVRRLVAGKVSVAVEFDLRERMYSQLQRLELGFFDGQQTGQLMSRATVDLQSIRFFLGYGLIFLTQNGLTIVLASIVMFAINPLLAALALVPVPIVVATAARYSRLSRPALQEVQQRLAELTAEAEESVSGIRVVKAFAREEHMLHRFQRSVARVFDQNVYSTRLARLLHAADGLPAVDRPRGGSVRRRAPGDRWRSVAGRVHRLLHVRDHADGTDAHARCVARDGAARRRLGQPDVRDPRSRAKDREPRRAPRRFRTVAGRSSCTT